MISLTITITMNFAVRIGDSKKLLFESNVGIRSNFSLPTICRVCEYFEKLMLLSCISIYKVH